MDVFDVSQGSWSTISFAANGKEGPVARSVAALLPVTIGAKQVLVTLFGERDPSSLGHQGAGKMLSDVWAFELGTRKWTRVDTGAGEQPDARGWYGADVLRTNAEDGIVVAGGLGEDNNRLNDAWLLTFQ